MPPILLILLGLLAATAFEEPVLSVELTLQTRGVRKSITVDPKQTRIDLNGQSRQVPTAPKQWRAILSALKGITLADLPSLKSTSSRASVDAALSARIRVTTATQTYESAPYDHPNPPASLAALVQAIRGSVPADSRASFR